MIRLAITIVHNKTDAKNEAQLQAFLPFVSKITDTNPVFNDQGIQTGTFDTYHYEITGLNLPHQARFYQIVPFGVTPPPSFYRLDSHNVLYRTGDEDKTGEHPRFFNWGLKRGMDQGAELVIYLQDVTQLTPGSLRAAIQTLGANDLSEPAFGKLATLRCLRMIGQLKEDRSFTNAVSEYKNRISQGGLKTG